MIALRGWVGGRFFDAERLTRLDGRPAGRSSSTVNLLQRGGNDLLVRRIEDLRDVVASVRTRPFTIHACAVLSDHLHYVIELPEDDADFSLRWRWIKSVFSKRLLEPSGYIPTAEAKANYFRQLFSPAVSMAA